MATIPNPGTIAVGQMVTSAYLNSMRDAVNFLTGQPVCVVVSSVTQSLASGAAVPLTFDTEIVDSDGMHSVTVSTSRITAVTPGWYRVTGTVIFSANGTGSRYISFFFNGATELGKAIVPAATTASLSTAMCTSVELYLNAGDYVELVAWQNSGAALSTILLSGGCRFSMFWERGA